MAEAMQSVVRPVPLGEVSLKPEGVPRNCTSDGSESFRSCDSSPSSTSSPSTPAEESASEEPSDIAQTKPVISEQELQAVLAELDRTWGDCCGLYVHGSTIFANQPPHDLDLIAVVDHAKQEVPQDSPDSQFTLGRCEVSVYERRTFLEKLEAMDLTMLTCLSTPKRFVLKELQDARLRDFKLDLAVLEESVVSYAEYTWMKAQRVLNEWKDPYKSSKNAYFVFRVLEFGCQFADHGRIVNLKAANHKWDVIRQLYQTLDIQPGEEDVIEAILGRHFKAAVADFQGKVATARGRTPASVPQPAQNWETCVICLEPVRGSACQKRLELEQLLTTPSDANVAETWVQLVNCRHCFHTACIADAVRASRKADRSLRHAACSVCRASVVVSLSEQRRRKRRMSFAGYPATIRHPTRNRGADRGADRGAGRGADRGADRGAGRGADRGADRGAGGRRYEDRQDEDRRNEDDRDVNHRDRRYEDARHEDRRYRDRNQ